MYASGARQYLLQRLRFFVFCALLISQILIQYWPDPVLQFIGGLVSFLAWAIALLGADRTSVMLSLVLVVFGTVIFASMGTDLLTALAAFGENSAILLLMVLVPLVGILIEEGGYSEALAELAESFTHPVYLFGFAQILVYSIGSVLLNASIALVWTVVAPIATRMGKRPEDVLVPCLPRSYNATLLWTPASPAMAVALSLTGASWTSVVRAGFVTSLFALAIAMLVEVGGPALRPVERRASHGEDDSGGAGDGSSAEAHGLSGEDSGPPRCGNSPDSPHGLGNIPSSTGDRLPHPTAWKKAGALATGLASFLAAVVVLQHLGQNVYQAIVLCIALTLVVWGSLIGKSKAIWKSSLEYFSKKLPGLSSQFLLMTTAGFIGTALQRAISSGLAGIPFALTLAKPVFTLAGSLLVWLLSTLGIHPLIGMTIVHSVIAPFTAAFSPSHVSMTLLLGAALGFTVSPVSATILVTSAMAGKSSIEVGFRRQWKYALSAWVVCSFVLSLFGL